MLQWAENDMSRCKLSLSSAHAVDYYYDKMIKMHLSIVSPLQDMWG